MARSYLSRDLSPEMLCSTASEHLITLDLFTESMAANCLRLSTFAAPFHQYGIFAK